MTGFHNFLCRISEASVAAEHAAGSCASCRDGPVWDVRGSECPVKGICLCHLPPLPPPQSKIRWEFHGGNWREPFSKLGKFALFFVSCFNAQQHSSYGGCSWMMHQHKEPGKCMHSVIKSRVNWACFGIWASGEQGEPVPPLPPAVAVPFSKILLSQLSTPYQSSAWSWWSYTTPNPTLSTQELAGVLQRALSTTPLLSPFLATLRGAEHQQCPKQLWVLRISLSLTPWAECTPHQRPHCGEAGELNVLLEGSTANQWQRRMTATPVSSFSFPLLPTHSDSKEMGAAEWECALSFALHSSGQLLPDSVYLPLLWNKGADPQHDRNEARDELTPSWWQFKSPHGFQGGGWGGTQFLNLSSNSSAKARLAVQFEEQEMACH